MIKCDPFDRKQINGFLRIRVGLVAESAFWRNVLHPDYDGDCIFQISGWVLLNVNYTLINMT